jgi:hypothetical protein
VEKGRGKRGRGKKRKGKEEKLTNPRTLFIPKHPHFQTLITPSISQYRL